jgi:hypothetical protein
MWSINSMSVGFASALEQELQRAKEEEHHHHPWQQV